MSLVNTNITTSLVGNVLGNASRSIGILCTASNINKWSRYKPVDYVYNWGANDFGLTFGNTTLGNFLVENYIYRDRLGNYALHPTAGFRLGDFRGYNHNAIRPISSEQYQSTDTYTTASFFAPTIETSSDIVLQDFINSLSPSAWTGAWHFGVRLTLPDGTKFYIIDSTDMKQYLVPGIYFDFRDNLIKYHTKGSCTYHTFITPLAGLALTEHSSLTTEQLNSPILFLPDGTGMFNWITAPALVEPAFYAGIIPSGYSLSGNVVRGDTFTSYAITKTTSGTVTVTVTLHITDADGNQLTTDTINTKTNESFVAGVANNYTINHFRSFVADYGQNYTISFTIT